MDRVGAKRRQVLKALAGSLGDAGLRCGEVMTSAPCCVGRETPALDLVRLFHAKRFRHLLVADEEGGLAGVISDRDVLRCLGPERRPDPSVLDGLSAASLMSTDLVTVAPETAVEQAVELMLVQGISCLPVMTEGRPVGILTNTDLGVVLHALLQTLRQPGWDDVDARVRVQPHN